MKKRLVTRGMIGLLFIAVAFETTALSTSSLNKGYPSLAPMLENVSPAVVQITVSKSVAASLQFFGRDEFRRFFNEHGQPRKRGVPGEEIPQRFSMGTASGVIIDAEKGHIVTNHHVIEGADTITVFLNDKRQYRAKLLGSDPATDIALLKIDAQNLVALPFSDIKDLQVGDYTVAIGHPFGFGQTVTSGIISALGRGGLNNQNYEDFIQTDATINKGNSGGALVDLEGNLIGINTAIVSRSGGSDGVGFAVPVDMMASVIEHLERDGEVRRGILGVMIRDMTLQIADLVDSGIDYGALVTSVVESSAAEQAGIQVSDVIVEIAGRRVEDGRELRNAVGLIARGKKVELVLYRGGRKMTLNAVIGGNQAVASVQKDDKLLRESVFNGVQLKDYENRKRDSDSEINSGVEVTALSPRSSAAYAGLKTGDIIYRLNREDIKDLRDFNRVVKDAGEQFALSILRGDRKIIVLLS